ncbi:hypothetical protein DLAC_09792 [Tieghemostelium lacteum]|uniref:Uncharacterized protein n=1 Tax=Tieghemostelium lacteum TaxID=361077 RepID=A0A151Z779_TIELA|nr:hypothetical protein DLAC_09792 [Tieghemostelium lacteum]|eukprot:KYQ89819.1 hypothetical protein DLAC_09792 [Tieghemostelium lacteum]
MDAIKQWIWGSDNYDFIIDITTIDDIKKSGWDIHIDRALLKNINKNLEKITYINSEVKGEPKIQKMFNLNTKCNSYTMVAVMGLFNRGKTLLINLLSNSKSMGLPSGKTVQTKGLSFKGFPNTNILYLDTAGTNSPLNYSKTSNINDNINNNINNNENNNNNNNIATVDPLVQKKATEMLMQELTFSLADIMIVVVNELTFADQEYLKVMRAKLNLSNKEYKQLFVVHNFNTVTDIDDLKRMWYTYVISTHQGQLKVLDVTTSKDGITQAIYFQEDEKDGILTLHFFLANNNGSVGKVWNPRTIAIIQDILKGRVVKQTEKPIDQIITDNISEVLKLYCKDPGPVEITTIRGWETQLQENKSSSKDTTSTTSNGNQNISPDFSANHSDPHDKLKKQWRTFEEPKKIESTSLPVFRIGLVKDSTNQSPKDINLKYPQVDIYNFQIMFVKNDFNPSFDIVMNKAPYSSGMTVNIDLPGFDEDNNHGGNVNFSIYRENDTSILRIEGRRNIYSAAMSKEGPERIEYTSNDLSKQKSIIRQHGKFQILIPIPGGINDDLSTFTTVFQNGQFSIILIDKEQKEPKKFLKFK